jgi:hypothetical protein
MRTEFSAVINRGRPCIAKCRACRRMNGHEASVMALKF